MNDKHQLNILYTNIGRGHPFYLDGIVESIRKKYSGRIKMNIVDAFEISSGRTLLLWRFVRWLYRAGSQGGVIGRLYHAFRKGRNPNRSGLLEKQLARDIRKYFTKNKYPTLVAHPILIPMLADIVDVCYQHGEIAVPDESIVHGARYIFVPLQTSKKIFTGAGLPEKDIVVSGLCIEPELAEKSREYFERRLKRIKNGRTLCGGFFSSGAEPKRHIEIITWALESIRKTGGRTCIFFKKNGLLDKTIAARLPVKVIDDVDRINNIDELLQSENMLAFSHINRQTENNFIKHLYRYLDYIVAPSHERTNWAVGLGLPMFILHPIIGTFSPLNRQFLLEQGAAIDLDSEDKAKKFGQILNETLRDGSLLKMARNGYGNFELNGFETIAGFLKNDLD
jgi:hypothetical protein